MSSIGGISIGAAVGGGVGIGTGIALSRSLAPVTQEASKLSKLVRSPLALGAVGLALGAAVTGAVLLGNGSISGAGTKPGECYTDFFGDGHCNPVPDRVIVREDGSRDEIYDGGEYYRQ